VVVRSGFSLRNHERTKGTSDSAIPKRKTPLRALANACSTTSCTLGGVFLFGMALSLVPFVLSWFLREKPLRTTTREAEEGSTIQLGFEVPES